MQTVFSKSMIRTAAIATVGIGLVGCSATAPNSLADAAANQPKLMDAATVTKAVATIGPAKSATTQPTNNNVTGTVTFTLDGDQLKFAADIDGFAPSSKHGFHIHEKGDLSDPDLKSAGGHFNPTKEKHGGPGTAHHHAGDLGNLEADANGHAHLEGTVMHAGFTGDTSILDRSVIIHAKVDDEATDPAGNSGARIAGGVIKAAP